MNRERWVTQTPEETLALGKRIAKHLRRGDVVALYGDLGSGKTQFVKGVAAGFRAHPHVSSPTFVIMNRYDGKNDLDEEIFLYHVDLYRVEGAEAILDLGLEEVMGADGVTLIEWAERMGPLLPERRFDVACFHGSREQERIFELTTRVDATGTAETQESDASGRTD
jgi:tRNA threonylcarbamoyladenosine biosynthesis protein TsaE